MSEPTRGSVRIRTSKSPTLSAFLMTDGTPDRLIVQWRELAEILRAEGCSEVAAARERCANELETVLHTTKNEPLSINQAAQESGYSAEYLRRLLRETPALNIGRVGKPLIRRGDLPRKATTALVGRTPKRYDVAADAQSLVGRQGVI